MGAAVGFYGVHINGEINEMYSSSNGTLWGNGGLSIALNVKRDFTKNVYGAFELRAIQKGSIYEFVTFYGTQAFEVIKLRYIEIPVLVGVKINLNKRYLLAETGFAYARMISSKMLVNDLKQWDVSHKLNNFKPNELSWIVNLKYPIIKNEKLLIGLRVSHSLFSIHSIYKLYNFDYGIELYYLFNRNVKRPNR